MSTRTSTVLVNETATNDVLELSLAQQDLKERARALARDAIASRAAEIDETEEYPTDIAQALAEHGFMGMVVPEEFGGANASVFDAALVIEEIAKVSAIAARIVVDANTGVPGAIIHYGTQAQKERYLPWLLEGEKPVIAITEPNHGSDANLLETAATSVGDGYVLNGEKRWISGGGVSRLYLVFARFDEVPGAKGVGGVLVESDNPGLIVDRLRPVMGSRGMPEADVILRDCKVEGAAVLVPPGDGFTKLMRAYNRQRIGAASICLGIAQGAFDLALDFVQQRKQFGQPIANFQGLRWMLADMHVKLECARMLIYRAARRAGHGFPDRQETAVAKLHVAEASIQVTDTALQLHGALGYSRELPLERMLRDVRLYAIGGGTAQVLRNIIAAKLLE